MSKPLFENEIWQNGFTQIPNVILRSPLLKPNEKLVYIVILSYAWSDDRTWPGVRRLADDVGLSKSTVSNVLQRLREVGLIDIVSGKENGHQTNIYIIRKMPDMLLPGGCSKPEWGNQFGGQNE